MRPKAKLPRNQTRRPSGKLGCTQPITKKLVRVLHERVQSGTYQGAFPSEWELAREFGVSRSSARLGVDQLVREGLLYRVPGKGTFLVPRTKARTPLLIAKGSGLFRRLIEDSMLQIRAELPHLDLQWVEPNDPKAEIITFIGSYLPSHVINLLPLDRLIRSEMPESRPRLQPLAQQAFQWRGVQYALPLGFAPMVLCFHRGLFQRAGLPEPTDHWKWHDLLDAARRLTNAMENQYGIALAPDPSLLLVFLWQRGGELQDSMTKEWRLRSPEFRAALQFYLEQSRCSPPSDDGTWRAAMRAAQQGQVAMVPHGFRSTLVMAQPDLPKPDPADWGFVQMPGEQLDATRILSEGVGIAAPCDQAEDAWHLIRILVGTAAQNSMNRTDCHLLPSNLGVRLTSADSVRALKYAESARLGWEHLPPGMMLEWKAVLRRLLDNQVSIEQAIEQFELAAVRTSNATEPGLEW
ncbi:MAG: extracellular solute-binding protein [Verrucomicrobia bacterium]|nr:extracellular solute-binding protein [Verrucomicrobiota bacterium]